MMLLSHDKLKKVYPDVEYVLENSDKPLRFLFLDIDGVLNSEKFFRSRKTADQIDSELVKKLNALEGVYIVISSSWGYNANTVTELKNHGLELQILCGVSPFHSNYGERGIFIKNWLDCFASKYDYKYAIIDDDNDMLPEQTEHFVRTDRYTGVTDEDIEKLKKILS